MGVLGERVALGQALRVDEAAGDRAGLLARGGGRRQRGVALLAPLASLGADPGGEIGQVVEVEIAEELGAAGMLVEGNLRQRRGEVVVEPGLEGHRRAAADQRHAGFAAQAEQALAQAGVGLLAGRGRPQQRRDVIALDRPRQGDEREQGRILRPQGDRTKAVRRDELGPAEQAQLPRARRSGARAAGGW